MLLLLLLLEQFFGQQLVMCQELFFVLASVYSRRAAASFADGLFLEQQFGRFGCSQLGYIHFLPSRGGLVRILLASTRLTEGCHFFGSITSSWPTNKGIHFISTECVRHGCCFLYTA